MDSKKALKVNKKESSANKTSYIDLVPEAFLKAWETKNCSSWSLKKVQRDVDRSVGEIKVYGKLNKILYICVSILLMIVCYIFKNQVLIGKPADLLALAFVLVFIFAVFYQINSDIYEKVSSLEFRLRNDRSWIDSFNEYVKSLLVNDKCDPFNSLIPDCMLARMVNMAQRVLRLEDRVKDTRINMHVNPVALKLVIEELMVSRTRLDTIVKKLGLLSEYFGDASDLSAVYRNAKKAIGK